jgi:hypothetical protein
MIRSDPFSRFWSVKEELIITTEKWTGNHSPDGAKGRTGYHEEFHPVETSPEVILLG